LRFPVLEWCHHHRDDPPLPVDTTPTNVTRRADDIPAWDLKYFEIEIPAIFAVMMVAECIEYIDNKRANDLGCELSRHSRSAQ